MTDGLSAMIIGFGGQRQADSYTLQSGRWARILAQNLFQAWKGGIPLSNICLAGRGIDQSFEQWKDVRGASAPSIKPEIGQLKSGGVGVDVLDVDINSQITAFGPERHEFNPAFLEQISGADLYIVSTSMIDRATGKDGHFPWIDAVLQALERREHRAQFKPVVLVETPLTVSYSTTKTLVEAAARQGVGIHENLIETFDPVKPAVAQFMKENSMYPRRLVIERSDNQINMENPGPVNRAMIAVRATPTWEKGIPHDLLPPKTMLQQILEKEVGFSNFKVVHAVPFVGKDGRQLMYSDGIGGQWTSAVDVVISYEAKAGDLTIPVMATWSFNRAPARKLEFYMQAAPGGDVVFYSSLPREQFRGELPKELQGSKSVTGYFAELRDGVRQLIAAQAANPLLRFVTEGANECLGRGTGLVTAEDSLYTAKVGQEITGKLEEHFEMLRKNIDYRTKLIYVSTETSPFITVAGTTKEPLSRN